MLNPKIIPAALVAVIALSGAGAAFAADGEREDDDRQEITAAANAKTSLSQVIAAAEQETGGKAIDAGLENQDGAMAYEVKIAKGDVVQKVLVALDTGKVIKVMAADAERDDDERDND